MRLRVRNWRDFQHYKDRCPPWIKLHFKILHSRDWVTASDSERVLAIACMLIASQDDANDGSFESDPDYFLRVAYLSKRPDFKPLIDRGFLESASDCNQTLEKCTTETETETETDKSIVGQKPDVSKRVELRNQAKEILAFLNAKAGRAFEEVPANLDRIEARLKEGADFHDCKSIVAKKCMEWKSDEKMADYLRPATLFNREKFWQYHGQLGAQ